ncbi:MAG: winged helix-turn-helix domain-containing protein [Candidatus Zixiibacteriota bacterium]
MVTPFRARRDFAGLEARRMAAAALFEQGRSQADVVGACHVSRQTASRWYADWHQRGRAGLRAAGRAGRKPRLSPRQLATVEVALRRGPTAHGYTTNLWTLPRIAQVIQRLCGVHYHPGHVWRLLGQMGWSCQKPRRQARERDEAAIRHWVKHRWPRLKKKPRPTGPPLSSSTNRGSHSDPVSAGHGHPKGRRPA